MAIKSFKNKATEDINYGESSKQARKLMSKSAIHITAVHPGAVLRDELEEIGFSQTGLAAHIGVLPKTINEICRGKRGISVEMALKLSQALGATPYFWLNLQNNWELSQLPSTKKIRPIAA